MRLVLCTLLVATVVASSPDLEFACDTNAPTTGVYASGHVLDVRHSAEFFTPGETFVVTLRSVYESFPIRYFSIQARDVIGNVWGTWTTIVGSRLQDCGENGDMLYSTEAQDAVHLALTWHAPPTEELHPRVSEHGIEFNISVMFDNSVYHSYKTPVFHPQETYDVHNSPSEFEEPAPNPAQNEQPASDTEDGQAEAPAQDESPSDSERLAAEEANRAEQLDSNGGAAAAAETTTSTAPASNLHDPEPEINQAAEEAARQAELLAEEDRNSEGDWTAQQEEERRQREEEYQWELQEMERARYEEERRRQEILQWEIRDKEEHDAMLARRTTPAVTPAVNNNDLVRDGSGANSITTSSMVGLITGLLLMLRLL